MTGHSKTNLLGNGWKLLRNSQPFPNKLALRDPQLSSWNHPSGLEAPGSLVLLFDAFALIFARHQYPMKRVLTLLLLTIYCTCGRAQNAPPNYLPLVTDAWSAFQADQPRKALKLYDTAFDVHPGEAIDLLRAAVIAKTIKKNDRAAALINILFKKYPLEAAVTFLESREFEFAREEPLYSSMLHLAANALTAEREELRSQDPTSHYERYTISTRHGSKGTSFFRSSNYHYVLNNSLYIVLVETAHHAMLAGDYQRAHDYYRNAFSLSQNSTVSLLRAAICAYRIKESETAAEYVEKAFKTPLPDITLSIIRLTPEFQPFLEYPQLRALVGKQINHYFPALNAGLVNTIDSLTDLFFTHRKLENVVSAEVFPTIYSLGISDASRRVLQDSIDLLISQQIDAILSSSGYPTYEMVADRLQDFDLLTHAVQPEVLEKHWDNIITGASTNSLSFFNSARDLASRYDENCYRLGRKQKFGCIWFVPASLKATGISRWPIEHPLLVNNYRAEVGLVALDNSPKSEEGYFNLEAQQQIGKLQPSTRDEVHAIVQPRRHPSVELFFRQ